MLLLYLYNYPLHPSTLFRYMNFFQLTLAIDLATHHSLKKQAEA